MDARLLKRYRREARKRITIDMCGKMYFIRTQILLLDDDYKPLHWDGDYWRDLNSTHAPALYNSERLVKDGYIEAVRAYILMLARSERRERGIKAIIQQIELL